MGFTFSSLLKNKMKTKTGRIVHISCIRQNKQRDKQTIPKPPVYLPWKSTKVDGYRSVQTQHSEMLHPFSIFQTPGIFSSGALWALAWLLCSKPFNKGDMLAMGYQNRPLAPNTFFWKGVDSSMTCYIKKLFLLEIGFHQVHLMLHCFRFARKYKQLITIYCVIHDFEDLHNFSFGYLF